MDNNKIVIRKKSSLGATIARVTLLTLLWLFVLFVIIVNFCFIFHLYSDTLVSFYLVLNLDHASYGQILSWIFGIADVTVVFSFFRLYSIRRADQ